MKKIRWFRKIILFLNILFAFLLLLSYVLRYFYLKSLPSFSIISLLVPFFLITNLLFVIYWAFRKKKYFFISFIVLLIGYKSVFSFYKIAANKEVDQQQHYLSLMSYNVRLFNRYDWINEKDIDVKISDFIASEDVDVLCLQEFFNEKEAMFSYYPYQYVKYNTANQQTGQAIFSKYPIISKGSLGFPNTTNNAIYADIIKEEDTVRIYNLHLESFRINPNEERINQKNSEYLLKRMGYVFKRQQEQVDILNKHRAKNSYQQIICGDFNNSSYSNIYKKIKGDMKDSFEEAGHGFGRTFDFKYFPLQIDFILVDPGMEVIAHKNFKQKYSDHYPLKTMLELGTP